MDVDKKNLFIIILIFAIGFSLIGANNLFAMIGQIVLYTIGIMLIWKDAIQGVKSLKKPTNEKAKLWLKNADNHSGRIGAWIIGLFLTFTGIINFKYKFLGASDPSGVLPNSFQFLFSFVLIILGLMLLFLAMMKTSKQFVKFIVRNWDSASKILLYAFIILAIFLVMSIISPFIWS